MNGFNQDMLTLLAHDFTHVLLQTFLSANVFNRLSDVNNSYMKFLMGNGRAKDLHPQQIL